MTHISVAICTRNRPDLIGSAVESVLRCRYPDFDVIVVDQSDDDATGRVVRALAGNDPRLRYVHTSAAGLSRAYNLAVAETSGEILAFTDDDCTVFEDWLDSIATEFANDELADLLYGQVLLPPELTEHDGVVPTLNIERRERLSARDGFRIYGMGANFAARRRLFERIGGFDELLGGGGPLRSSQDFDFQFRVFRSGRVSVLSPTVKVFHYGLRTDIQWPATLRAYGVGDGAFYWKHVRCGDWLALAMLANNVIKTLARVLLNPLRRRPSPREYLIGCLEGLAASCRYGVDRRLRLYIRPRST